MKNNELPLLEQVQFATLAIEPLSKIHDELFNALAPYTQKIDQLPPEAQAFFISILPKITLKDIAELFDNNFSESGPFFRNIYRVKFELPYVPILRQE